MFPFDIHISNGTDENKTKRNEIQLDVASDKILNLGFALITNAFQEFQCIDHIVGYLNLVFLSAFHFYIFFLV